MRGIARAGLVVFAAAVVLPLTAGAAAAHPLGNFTVNHYAGLVVRQDKVMVDVVVDSAEIPAFQRRAEIDANGDKTIDAAERSTFGAAECSREVSRFGLNIAGHSAALSILTSSLVFETGAAGLQTMRLECKAQADAQIDADGTAIALTRQDAASRIGWREMTAQGDGVTLSESTVPTASVSDRLRSYPEDLLASPLAVTSASVVARPGGAALGASPAAIDNPSAASRGIDRMTAAFQKYVGRRELTPLVALVALFFATVLGSTHALAPGHGKTVMAAFIVGERGSLRQAGVIGLTVTVTHTAGVLVLGIVLSAADIAAPRVYGILGFASGVLLGSVGVVLLTRALRQRRRAATPVAVPAQVLVSAGAAQAPTQEQGHSHGHGHGPGHDHEHPHPHPHDNAEVAADSGSHRHGLFSHTHVLPAPDKPLGWRSIVAMGFAGGLVPSPSALVVLLGAVALGRTWFGVVLVVAYGAGMALTLTGTGLLLSRASRRIGAGAASFGPRMQRAMRVAKLLPIATAGIVLTVGVTIALQGLRAAL